ncbi:MAG: glycosyltransferase family 4 protein [Planctomycetota bacterium]
MLVYASFDAFPAPKGAATHLAAFAEALGRARPPLQLVTVEAGPGAAAHAVDLGPGVVHVPLPAPGKDLIERVLAFREGLRRFFAGRRADLVHVRSIYEGYPLARTKGRSCARLLYEVNGLPSIELKYHYPLVAEDPELLRKLERQEAACLEAADLVVTPSAVTGELLLARGLAPARLRVIPNGVDLARWRFQAPRRAPEAPLRLLYAGTLTSWQGVFVALEALRLLRRDHPAELTLTGPARKEQRRRLLDRAHELGVEEALELRPPCPRDELVALHHAHDVALAPLLPNDRNLLQGCCPLKVIEAMAAGTPVVASDMPVVRALAQDGAEALLVRPGSAKALKDGLLRLLAEPALGPALAARARARVEAELTWERSCAALLAAYAELLGAPVA